MTTTKDDDMSIKREDVDASRVDFADVGTASGCRLSTRAEFCVTIFCCR